MSADVLRQAAALMRERAEAATPSPWVAVEGASAAWWVELPSLGDVALDLHGENARHIASWHPAVALTIADWLDAKAEQDDKGTCDGAGTKGVCNLCEHDYGHIAALAVARAYLNDPAP